MSVGAAEIKIAVSIQNQERINQLTKDIAKQEEEILKLNAAYQAGTISQQQFLQQASPFAAKIGAATKEIQALKGAIGQASSAGAMGLLELSRAVEDAQYGFNAIVNNIPGIVMGLGMGAGVAGAASIAAVALNQLLQHVNDISDAFQAGWTGQSVEDLARLREQAEKAAEAFDKLAKTPSKAQAAQAKGIAELITEGPTEDTLKRVAEAVAADPALRTAAEKARPAPIGVGAPGVIGQAATTQEELNRKAMEANVETAKKLLGQAALPGKEGEKARQTLLGLVKRNPGAFPEGFASEIEAKSPEGQKRQRDFEAQLARRKKIEDQIAHDAEHKNAAAEKQSREQGRLEREQREKKARLDELQQRFALQDKVAAARQELHAAQLDTKKPFKGDYFEYATSHGEAYTQKVANEKLEAIRKAQEQAVTELQKFNEKQQLARVS